MRADAPRAGGPRLAPGGASATRRRSTRVTAPRLRARAGGDYQGGADHAPAGARERPAAVVLVRAQPQSVDGHAVRVRRLRAQHHEVRLPGGAPPVGPGAAQPCARAVLPGGACWGSRRRAGAGEGCGRGCTCLQPQDIRRPCRVRPATRREGRVRRHSPRAAAEYASRERRGPGRAPPGPGG